jgi:peptidyl-prolyl cis-trans isomerase SurA
MRRLSIALAVAIAVGLTIAPRPAEAVIVDRVVAVVGDQSILLSELRQRAKPQLTLLAADIGGEPTRMALGEPAVLKSVLDRMIDERLLEQQAARAHITFTAPQIDEAIKTKAAGVELSVGELLATAAQQGFTEQAYRDEVRRQLIEGRLLQLYVAARVRITETDERAAYAHLGKQLEEEAPVVLQVLPLRLQPGTAAAQQKLADYIVARAAAGDDWCTLVAQYGSAARGSCGDSGAQPSANIAPEARAQLEAMHEGDISKPVRMGDDAIVVFRLAKRVTLPPFEEVRAQVNEQAAEEALLRERDGWLRDLRRRVFVDIRL